MFSGKSSTANIVIVGQSVITEQGTIAVVDGVADAIKAKTDNLPASPAAVGSAMTLADDAITSAKFDESTAFPLKSADTGATAVNRLTAQQTRDTMMLAATAGAPADGSVDWHLDAIDSATELTFGYVSTGIDATISSRAAATDLATVDGIVDAIKLKTDNLPSDPADQSAVEAAITAATSPLATSAALTTVDTVVDAVKAVTDKVDTMIEVV